LAQEQQAQRMIKIRVGQKNTCNRRVARSIPTRLQLRSGFDLPGQVRGSVNQPPVLKFFRAGTERDARLRLRSNFSRARCNAVYTGTVPLRQAAAGRAAEDMDPKQPNL
jgi:hypothetical protein